MRDSKRRIVYRRYDGQWANHCIGAIRATSLHSTREEAVEAARKALTKAGGGELHVSNRMREPIIDGILVRRYEAPVQRAG